MRGVRHARMTNATRLTQQSFQNIQEQKMVGRDPETKYKTLRDLALNMSRTTYVEKRDNKRSTDRMDVSHLGATGLDLGADSKSWEEFQRQGRDSEEAGWQAMINFMKGKGEKGGKGKGKSWGKGKGYGFQPYQASKGAPKGKGKGGKGTIFYGTCYQCGAIGHSSARPLLVSLGPL